MNRNLQAVKTERLQAQHDFFDTLRSNHIIWLEEADNAGIQRMHADILNLLQNIQEKYSRLLDMYDGNE